MLGLLGSGAGRAADDRVYGLVIGIVTDNDDPDELGRVKVKFPWLGDDVESCWARVAAPGRRARHRRDVAAAGQRRGPGRRSSTATCATRTSWAACGTAWTRTPFDYDDGPRRGHA